MKIALTIAIVMLALGSVEAHAQRYDSSYGYEMRGFVPPSPFPRDLERKGENSHGEHTPTAGASIHEQKTPGHDRRDSRGRI